MRLYIIPFRTTAAERELLQCAATRNGETVSTLVRDAAISRATWASLERPPSAAPAVKVER